MGRDPGLRFSTIITRDAAVRRKQIVVIGSHDSADHLREAEEIGGFIARRGWVLVSGGRGGIMEAASRGASREGGIAVGIIPGSEFVGANPHCTIVIPSGIGYARNMTNILSGDVVVAIGGGAGTLSELSFASLFGKPTILCLFAGGCTERYADIKVPCGRSDMMHPAHNLEEVFALLDRLPGGS